ncbi:HAD family hydrolase [Paenibacillus pinistramenti]|uniref:HAD family hydrolase n=1 Tax=Paenibacillus pinistramenti TaxID=1768003 RepID=UPI001109DAF5|nr:HAD family hydrolase [Paenibacillus pinistramenti]
MNYKACVLDLDGTLLNSSKAVSERSTQIILKAAKAGVKIIIATARPPRAVMELLPQSIHRISSFIYCVRLDPEVDLSIEVEDKWYSLREYDEKTLSQVRGRPEVKTLEELGQYSPTKIIISGSKGSDWTASEVRSRAEYFTDGSREAHSNF